MKQATLFAVLIAANLTCFGRNNQQTVPTIDTTTGQASLQSMLSAIMGVTGLHTNFELKEARVRNIEASISRKKRMILYNPAFMESVHRATNDKWGIIALLAHEVGHHLNGHTVNKKGSHPRAELEADEFAGFVLHRLGASMEEAQAVIHYISGTKSSSTHPGKAERIAAIRKGWNSAT